MERVPLWAMAVVLHGADYVTILLTPRASSDILCGMGKLDLGAPRYVRMARGDDEVLQQLQRRYPRMSVSEIVRLALGFGLRAAQERPAEVFLAPAAETAR